MFGYVVENVITDETLEKQLSESGVVYDFMTIKLDGSGDNVNVVLQDLGVLYGTILKTEALLKQTESQLKQMFATMGYPDVKLTQENIMFAGAERPSFLVELELSGAKLYERQIMIRQDQYLCAVTATSTGSDKTDEELELFYPLS